MSDSRRGRPAKPGVAEDFHKEAERIAVEEDLFLQDAFDRIRERDPELYGQWRRETGHPDIAPTLRPDLRQKAAAIRAPAEELMEEDFAGFVAARPLEKLHQKLAGLLEMPKTTGRRYTLKEVQEFHAQLAEEGVVVNLADFEEVLDLLDRAAGKLARLAGLQLRFERALRASNSVKGASPSERARLCGAVMLRQPTRPGPKTKRNALQVVQAYLALTTGVNRSVELPFWHGKTYADYDLEAPPLIKCLRESYQEHGMVPPKRYKPTDELHPPLFRRDALAIVAQHFGWKNPDSCVKFLERQGVVGLPGDFER